MPIEITPEWLGVGKAAQYIDVSPKTVRRLMKQGLKYSRMPTGTIRIRMEWLDDYLNQFVVEQGQSEEIVDELLRGIL